ncbi:MAG: GNAT family N-acetyltransferase [Candidatus Omnitrophica bacterium]|nr:GNAT family N-acetyltransferase [Candidatus Omnitrophota bacterium]
MKQVVLNHNNIFIRKFKEQDSKKVKDLIITILSKEFAIEKSAYPETDMEHINSSYGGKRDTFLVLVSEEKPIGTVAIKEDSKFIALLRRFFVLPKFRKQGLGTLLLKEAIKFCREKGFHEVVFRTTDRMGSAIKLCKKNGFIEREKIPFENFQIIKFVLTLK